MTIFSWKVQFAQPLWFGILAALPLWIVFWRRSLMRLSAARKLLSITLRTILLAAVAVGLAGPTANLSVKEPYFWGGLDWSRHGPAPAVELDAPDHVRAGEPFKLDVLVRSDSAGIALVELDRDALPILQEKMELVVGENHDSIDAMVEKPSQVVYAATVTGIPIAPYPADPRNVPAITAARAIFVDPPPRILLVASQPALAEQLKKALIGEHVEVDARADLPGSAELLGRYDLAILTDVHADALSKAQMTALQTYVRDGGGLIAIGGDHSFTVGGYRHTPLEELLPVISESRTTKPKPTLAMVLVLDISGSMNDPVSKGALESNKKLVRNIDLAKEALRRAVGMLGPRDQVGVLIFEDNSRWIWPLGPVKDKAKILAKIDTIQAEGETNMYPPLEQAYLALRESYADVKHIIVATDGIGAPGDFDGLAKKIAAAGITMSTVGVGSEPVRPFIQKLADEAKGRAYFCDNGEAIPQIFQADTGVAAKIGITEEPFFPQVVHSTPIFRGLDMNHAPALLGYVETVARPEANIVLAAKSGEPILATWNYGRGTVAAFTSDVQSRWAAPWLSWPGFGRFWAQLARETMRRELQPTSRLTAEAADGRLYITLDAEDRTGNYINAADARVTVEQDNGKQKELAMCQIAPGRYTAWQPAGLGTYWLSAQIRRDGKLLDTARGAAAVLSMPETVLKLDGSVEAAEKPGLRTVLIWPWLLGFAAVVLVLDLAVRRTAR
jgi:uncharacterized membrane protein